MRPARPGILIKSSPDYGRRRPDAPASFGSVPLAYLSRLTLTNYRNFRQVDIELPPGVAVFAGANAQGKTALLEAAYTLAVGQSFRAGSEREVVNFAAAAKGEAAYVSGVAQRGNQQLTVVVGYLPAADPPPDMTPDAPADAGDADTDADAAAPALPPVRKQIRVNRQPARASGLLGQIGAALFFADDLNLALGSPSHRRRYLDILASQCDRYYLAALQRYQAALRHRNGLLRRQWDTGGVTDDEMRYWDEQLLESGTTLMLGRRAALDALAGGVNRLHRDLSDLARSLRIMYKPRTPADGAADAVKAAFCAALRRTAGRERATTVGPHRDDVDILLGGLPAGSFASRGEARTIALALRLAEAEYLAQARADDPVILLDDAFSEMDASRRERVLQKAAGYRQTLIATTEIEPIRAHFGDNAAYFQVADNSVTRQV